MKEACAEQAAFFAWVNREDKIITFRDTEGFERLSFQSQEEKMARVYNLCESGYKIL